MVFARWSVLAVVFLSSSLFALGNILCGSEADSFDIANPNYIVSGLGTHRLQQQLPLIAGQNNQAKFRININFKLAGWSQGQSGLYIGYTQLSFWNIFDPGCPFAENNYKPELFVYFDARTLRSSAWYTPSLKLGVVHESNGAGVTLGRSWNRLLVGAEFGRGSALGLSAHVSTWYVIDPKAAFRGMYEHLGDGELRLNWRLPQLTPSLRLGVGLASRFVYKKPALTNFELNLFIDPFRRSERAVKWLPTFMVQYFRGSGQGMLAYDQRSSALRLGVAFLY